MKIFSKEKESPRPTTRPATLLKKGRTTNLYNTKDQCSESLFGGVGDWRSVILLNENYLTVFLENFPEFEENFLSCFESIYLLDLGSPELTLMSFDQIKHYTKFPKFNNPRQN